MTDEQIIKALECCGEIDRIFCDSCKYKNEFDCVVALARDALDLIRRQKAEIDHFADIGKMYSEVRAEAIREFVESLKKKYENHIVCTWTVLNEEIDNLVKEMTEEKQ